MTVINTNIKALYTQSALKISGRESQVAMDTLVMSWGTPFETLLLSAAAGPTHAATLLVTPEVQSFSPEQRQDTTRFLSPFQDLSLPALQGRYFRLAPGAYREIAPGVH